jgi:hypothetical protein
MKLVTITIMYANSFGDIFLGGDCFLIESNDDITTASKTLAEKAAAEKCIILKQAVVWPTDEMVAKLLAATRGDDADA